uniref:Putative transforming growth factor-beta-induced protein ig-h3 n=1 Tax=Amblyomma parvum TaxID=251391 RepID=A0A023G0K4_AMBPA
MATAAGLRPALRLGLLLLLTCCAYAEEQSSDVLVREARAVGQFRGLYEFLQQRDSTVFCKYLRRAQVEDVLASLPSLTIIAPNDLAFAALPPSVIKMLETDSRFLRKFVLHHIVGDSVNSRSLRGDLEITTAGGDNILVKVYDNGRTVSLGGANILLGDASYENVIIHIVDRVLYPIADSLLSQTIQAKFGYFYRLLQSSGFASVLNSDLYTVFIPTQDAINNLPTETSQKILSDSELLKRVISHHIVPGLQFSAALKDGATLTPLDGEVLRITTQAGQLFIDGVPFVSRDDGATNGVIHIVNRLLVPQSVIEDCGCVPSHGGGDSLLTGGKITFPGTTIVGQQLPGVVQHVVVPGRVTQTTHIVSPPKTIVLGPGALQPLLPGQAPQ